MNPRARFVRQLPLGAAAIFVTGTIFVTGLLLTTGRSHAQATREAPTAGSGACVGDNGGITLSPGFCATVFADKLGHARHMAVAPNGVVYVNTWSGRYYRNDTPPPGGFLIACRTPRARWLTRTSLDRAVMGAARSSVGQLPSEGAIP